MGKQSTNPLDQTLSPTGRTDEGLHAGVLKDVFDLQSRQPASDDQGGLYDRIADWSTIDRVFVRDIAQPMSALQGEQLISVVRHIVIMRYRTDVVAGTRLVSVPDGAVLTVQVAVELGNNRQWTKAICVETAPDEVTEAP